MTSQRPALKRDECGSPTATRTAQGPHAVIHRSGRDGAEALFSSNSHRDIHHPQARLRSRRECHIRRNMRRSVKRVPNSNDARSPAERPRSNTRLETNTMLNDLAQAKARTGTGGWDQVWCHCRSRQAAPPLRSHQTRRHLPRHVP